MPAGSSRPSGHRRKPLTWPHAAQQLPRPHSLSPGPVLNCQWKGGCCRYRRAPALARRKAGSSQVPPLTPAWGARRQGGRGQRLLSPICPTAAELCLLPGSRKPGLGEHGGPGPALDPRVAAGNPASRRSRLLFIRLFVLLLPSVSSPGNRKWFCAMGSDRKLMTNYF